MANSSTEREEEEKDRKRDDLVKALLSWVPGMDNQFSNPVFALLLPFACLMFLVLCIGFANLWNTVDKAINSNELGVYYSSGLYMTPKPQLVSLPDPYLVSYPTKNEDFGPDWVGIYHATDNVFIMRNKDEYNNLIISTGSESIVIQPKLNGGQMMSWKYSSHGTISLPFTAGEALTIVIEGKQITWAYKGGFYIWINDQ